MAFPCLKIYTQHHKDGFSHIRSRDLVSRGEWLATILDRFNDNERGAQEILRAIADAWKEEDCSLPEDVDRGRA
jgi:hypothetical protein